MHYLKTTLEDKYSTTNVIDRKFDYQKRLFENTYCKQDM